MKTRNVIFLFVFSFLTFIACEKGPGEGGTNTIKGRVMVYDYDKYFKVLRDSFPGAKEDVFLIFGDDEVYGDKFETSANGMYEFKYLREGTYTVFAYSDTLYSNGEVRSKARSVVIEISGKNKEVVAPDLRIHK